VPELDLNLLGLYRVGGKSAAAMPGLAALMPPRRAARGRERDRLVIYLALAGNTPFSAEDYQQLVDQMGATFYHTSGSLTFALKTAAESANTALMERNMRTTGHGQYAMAVLALGALRSDQFYLVQCGPSHAFWLGPAESRQYFEPQLAGRGLGFSQTPRLYFSQLPLQPGDRVVFAAQMPSEWEHALLEVRSPTSLEATRRRLLAAAAPDIHAALIQAQAGKGQLNMIQPQTAEVTGAPATASPVEKAAPGSVEATSEPAPLSTAEGHPDAAPVAAATGSRLAAFTAMSVPSVMPDAPLGSPPLAEILGVENAEATPQKSTVNSEGIEGGILINDQAVKDSPPPQAAGPSAASHPVRVMARQPVSAGGEKKRRGQGVFLALGRGMHATRVFFIGLGARTRAFLPRLLPNLDDDPAGRGGSRGVSRSTLLFIAIAVPVLIATAAAMVYFEQGRSAQYQTFYARAEQQASQAVASTDSASQRQYWSLALQQLDQAESYARTDQSKALRAQAQNSLDALDRIVRLDYKHALSSGLSGNFTRMVATNSDVYLLDGDTGKVLRAVRSQLGYTLDSTFQCNPGPYSSVTVGPLVDLMTLPATNTVGADIMAVDAVGNALYCAPDQPPQPFQLAPPPQPLQQITAIASEGGTLYVLDAPGKAIWEYDGSQGVFDTTPLSFFGLEVPPLDTTTGMTIVEDNLFLLHSDGHLTTCNLSPIPDVSPTRCQDPAMLVDTRPGYPSGATLNGASFSQIQGTLPPNTTVALLDGPAQAIYRFSPSHLELQDQLRAAPGAADSLPQGVPASAFTIGPNHTIYLVVDGNLFYAEETTQ